MSENSAIEWTDATWSPWEGCTKVGPGCDHCYAEGMNRWLRRGENWGPGAPRREYSAAHWDKPLKWNEKAAKAGVRYRVFPSVCDPFDNEVPDEWRVRFFRLIAGTPHLDWLLLTKRIGNAKSMLPADWGDGYHNVWFGNTVVNQMEADRDLQKLRDVPAAMRFISYEPALGPIEPRDEWAEFLHWVIGGGESGPGARPAHPDWFRAWRDWCARHRVAWLFKQWGEWSPGYAEHGNDLGYDLLHSAQQHEWPQGYASFRVGKKAAGRLLDGRTHDGFPLGAGAQA